MQLRVQRVARLEQEPAEYFRGGLIQIARCSLQVLQRVQGNPLARGVQFADGRRGTAPELRGHRCSHGWRACLARSLPLPVQCCWTRGLPAPVQTFWRWNRYPPWAGDRKSTRLNSSHRCISYAVFCLKKKIE